MSDPCLHGMPTPASCIDCMDAGNLERLAEELAARRVRCHVCGARVYVGETAHDAEPADDGAERFACAEHCEVCR